MREELVEKLRTRYDRLFTGPVPIECDDGWYGILDMTMGTIVSYIISREKSMVWAQKQMDLGKPAMVPPLIDPVSIDQIKEKFGSLNFRYHGGDNVISGMVLLAEAMSEITCEVCGNVGTGRYGRWMKTLCDQHFVEHALRSE